MDFKDETTKISGLKPFSNTNEVLFTISDYIFGFSMVELGTTLHARYSKEGVSEADFFFMGRKNHHFELMWVLSS